MSNVDRHRRAHEAFNRRDWDGMAQDLHPEVTYTDHGRDMTVKSAHEFKEWVQGWANTASDATVAEPTYYDAGSTTMCVFTARGTNDGPLGPFPASGQRLSWPMCEIFQWDEQGRAVSGEVFYDQMGILVQAGHIPAPPKG